MALGSSPYILSANYYSSDVVIFGAVEACKYVEQYLKQIEEIFC
jgi:hypothetical protein